MCFDAFIAFTESRAFTSCILVCHQLFVRTLLNDSSQRPTAMYALYIQDLDLHDGERDEGELDQEVSAADPLAAEQHETAPRRHGIYSQTKLKELSLSRLPGVNHARYSVTLH